MKISDQIPKDFLEEFIDNLQKMRNYLDVFRSENVSPELRWTSPPKGTRQLMLVMEDVDSPSRETNIHMLAFFEPRISSLSEGSLVEENKHNTYIPDRKGIDELILVY